MESLITAMDFAYTADEIAQALSSFSPDMYDAFLRSALNTAQNYDAVLQDRAELLRLYKRLKLGAAPSDRAGLNTLAVMDGKLSGLGAGSGSDKSASVWAQAMGSSASRRDSDDWLGYDLVSTGVAFGFDGALTPWLTLGASLGLGNTDMDYSGDLSHDGEQKGIYGALYASAAGENAYLDAGVSYGFHDNEAWRGLDFLAGSATARADFDSQTWLGRVKAGYDFSWGRMAFGSDGSAWLCVSGSG
jgi:outer membrane autotransporter protein